MLWHWVVAAAAPGVAGEHTFEREPRAFEGAILLDSLDSVVGTGRCVAARASDKGRERPLVDLDQGYQDASQARFEAINDFFHKQSR